MTNESSATRILGDPSRPLQEPASPQRGLSDLVLARATVAYVWFGIALVSVAQSADNFFSRQF